MEGGDGSDTYVVDDAGDTLTETNAVATLVGSILNSALTFHWDLNVAAANGLTLKT